MTDCGLSARRTQQFCGNSGDASDVICDILSKWFIEVKRVQNLSIHTAFKKAHTEASRAGKKVFVAHRKNHTDWLITLDAKEFLNLLQNVAGNEKNLLGNE